MIIDTDSFLREAGEVHLWWVSLPAEIQHVNYFYRVLSDEEWERAARFYYQKDRDYFVVSRGVLRILLGRYLKKEPEGLRIICHRFGKPCLDTTQGDLPLHFNLSHSQGLAVYALSGSRKVGIDIESTGTDIDMEEIAKTFPNPLEINDIMRHPSERKKETLLQYWAFREACLKATGEGIFFASTSFEISQSMNQAAVILKTGSRDGQGFWSLRRLDAPQGYVAALAIEGEEDFILKSHQWETPNPMAGSRFSQYRSPRRGKLMATSPGL